MRLSNSVRRWLAVYVLTGLVVGLVSDLMGASQNLMVFRSAALALVQRAPIYGRFSPDYDFYKYSPTFALAFLPFAILPWHVAAVLWSMLNFGFGAWGMVRFARVTWPAAADRNSARLLALAYPGILLTTDGDQSNLLVAGACLLAAALYAEERPRAAAPWLAFSILVKLFPVVFGVFALVGRQRVRAALALALATVAFVLLPALVVGPTRLLAYYREWRELLAGEPAHAFHKHWSLMHVASTYGLTVSTLAVQVAGGLVFLAGAAGYVRQARRALDPWVFVAGFAFVLLFNHRSESPTFVFSGIAAALFILATPQPRAWHWLFYGLLLVAPSPLYSEGGAHDLAGYLAAKRLFHPWRLAPLTMLWLWATWRLLRPLPPEV